MIKSILKRRKAILFFLILVLIGFFPIFILTYSYYRDYKSAKELFIIEQSEVIENYEYIINREIENIFSDLEYLYLAPIFQKYLKESTDENDIEQSWKIYSKAKGKYDQIRFIAADGNEKIRINYNNGEPGIVNHELLQNKSNRYYFSMLKEFKEPTILVSKFDLNVERNEIETPYKPMLRISLPIFNKSGSFQGAIVLNYLGDNLLGQLKSRFLNNENKVFILNPEGFILLGPDVKNQWGFMFENGKDKTFKKLYESDWNRVQNDDIEVYHSKVGLYLNKKINNGPIVLRNSERDAFTDFDIYTMDKFLSVIILGEHKCNPIFCEHILLNILNTEWKILILLSITSILLSYFISTSYVKKINSDRLKEHYKSAMKEVIKILEVTTSLEDDDTGSHIKRVCHYTEILARGLKLPKNQVELISDMASLHDIGKVGIHDNILKKNGKLTDLEREEMKKHVDIGHELILHVNMDNTAANIIRYHHENWDKSGYNAGIEKEEIPLEARIVALADVYDALRSTRSYKPAFSHEKAREIILEEKGKKFDPEIVGVFINNEEEFINISFMFGDEEDTD
jgi:hypothetical protein